MAMCKEGSKVTYSYKGEVYTTWEFLELIEKLDDVAELRKIAHSAMTCNESVHEGYDIPEAFVEVEGFRSRRDTLLPITADLGLDGEGKLFDEAD